MNRSQITPLLEHQGGSRMTLVYHYTSVSQHLPLILDSATRAHQTLVAWRTSQHCCGSPAIALGRQQPARPLCTAGSSSC